MCECVFFFFFLKCVCVCVFVCLAKEIGWRPSSINPIYQPVPLFLFTDSPWCNPPGSP